jgi:hypothetical protein
MTRAILSILLIFLGGCGYTSASLLPSDVKSIHVTNFSNKIDPAREVSDRRMAYLYRPGLETEITRAAIDGFIFDGYLQIKSRKEADLMLKGELVDLQQYPLSYSAGGGNVEEYRVELMVDLECYDNRSGELMWKEKRFMGQSTYDTSGREAKTEAEGVTLAVKDLARRIVERTVEAW